MVGKMDYCLNKWEKDLAYYDDDMNVTITILAALGLLATGGIMAGASDQIHCAAYDDELMKENALSGILTVLTTFALLTTGDVRAEANCRIRPEVCSDELRFTRMAEHIATIEKSMEELSRLSADKAGDVNQAVRLVQNKDKHADNLGEIAAYYFMAQRVAPIEKSDVKCYDEYLKQISLLHQLMYRAIKVKQSTDPKETAKLRKILDQFRESYFNEQSRK